MCSFVNFEVFAASEDFSTSRERAREGLFARVDPDVVNQLVLRFEWFKVSGASFPIAHMTRLFRTSNMLHCDVGDDFMHGGESLIARLPWFWLLWIDPEARMFLLDGRTHVSEESASLMVHVVHVVQLVHGVHVIVMTLHLEMSCSEVVVGSRRGHLRVLIRRPRVHVAVEPGKAHLSACARGGVRSSHGSTVVKPREKDMAGDWISPGMVVKGSRTHSEHASGGLRFATESTGHVFPTEQEVSGGVVLHITVRLSAELSGAGRLGVRGGPGLPVAVHAVHGMRRTQLQTGEMSGVRGRRIHEGIEHPG